MPFIPSALYFQGFSFYQQFFNRTSGAGFSLVQPSHTGSHAEFCLMFGLMLYSCCLEILDHFVSELALCKWKIYRDSGACTWAEEICCVEAQTSFYGSAAAACAQTGSGLCTMQATYMDNRWYHVHPSASWEWVLRAEARGGWRLRIWGATWIQVMMAAAVETSEDDSKGFRRAREWESSQCPDPQWEVSYPICPQGMSNAICTNVNSSAWAPGQDPSGPSQYILSVKYYETKSYIWTL